MDAQNFTKLQQQIRNNQNELQDFVSDLDGWLDSQSRTKTKKSHTSVETSLPPIRHGNNKDAKKKKVRLDPEDANKHAEIKQPSRNRISGFDYKAWDRFDAEKALQEIENSNPAVSTVDVALSCSAEETDDEEEENKRRRLVDAFKDRGNQMFRIGDFKSAIENYTQALTLDPLFCTALTNRALCLIKQGSFIAAVNDCTSALDVEPSNVKAFYRRGLAYKSIGKSPEAEADFKQCLKLDPQNIAARQELDNLNGVVQPSFKSISGRSVSSRSLVRVPIEEISGEGDSTKLLCVSSPTDENSSRSMVETTSSLDTSRSMVKRTIELITSRSTEQKTSELNTSKSTITAKSLCLASSSQFLQSLKRLAGSNVENSLRADLVTRIGSDSKMFPGGLRNLFKQGLETEILISFMRCIEAGLEVESLNSDQALKLLLSTVELPRFQSAWMFATTDEKQLVSRLLDSLSNNISTQHCDSITSLKSTFR